MTINVTQDASCHISDAIPKTTIHLSNHIDDSQTRIDEDSGFSTVDRASQRRSQRKPPRVTPLPPYTA